MSAKGQRYQAMQSGMKTYQILDEAIVTSLVFAG
jgi:hypothetical protein